MSNQLKTLLATIIFFAVFVDFSNLEGIIKTAIKKDYVVSIEPAPEDSLLEMTLPVANLVSDKQDKATLALFNNEFADRILLYPEKMNTQELQNVYALAGASLYEKSLSSKYENLGKKLESLIADVVGHEEHMLSLEEAEKLSKIFKALSWNLSR